MGKKMLSLMAVLILSAFFSNVRAEDNSVFFEKYKNSQPLTPSGSWGEKLIAYVAKDQSAEKSAVQLYKQHEAEGQGNYIVKVNGTFFAYTRVGSVFRRAKVAQKDTGAQNAFQQKYKDTTPLAPKGEWGKKLVTYAAKDKDVEESGVQIFKQYEGSGQGEYVVKVNGEFYEYKRMGSVYYDAANPPF